MILSVEKENSLLHRNVVLASKHRFVSVSNNKVKSIDLELMKCNEINNFPIVRKVFQEISQQQQN